jgi:hypothetical protein
MFYRIGGKMSYWWSIKTQVLMTCDVRINHTVWCKKETSMVSDDKET